MEKPEKPKKTFQVVVLILLAICIVQGLIIYKYVIKDNSDSDIFFNKDKFSTFLDNKFKKDKDEKWDLYDRFFNDDFFSKQSDPFKEMEEMQQRMEDMMGDHTRKMFKDSWNGWFDDRFIGQSDDISIDTNEKKNAYIVTVKIPNLKENKLKINIDKEGIAIDGEFSQTVERKDRKGHILGKHEMYQSLSKQIPIPNDVDVDKAKIDQKKDKIIITLPKA